MKAIRALCCMTSLLLLVGCGSDGDTASAPAAPPAAEPPAARQNAAIEKAKGVQDTLDQAADRQREAIDEQGN